MTWWYRLRTRPGGRWLFKRMLSRAIPYTGTISPEVIAIEPGYARVELRDRKRIRNHLASVHAIALANLGELTTGLAVTSVLAPAVRGIPIALHIDYLKKARGRLIAECNCEAIDVTEPIDFQASATIRDADGDEVAVLTATWRLSPS